MRDQAPSSTIKIQPIINYPREARVGESYLLTIDVRLASLKSGWEYPEEEYPIKCVLNVQPYFSYEVLGNGEPGIVLHRFGGTYGAAHYLLKACERKIEKGTVSITLLNARDIPIAHIELECEVKEVLEGEEAREKFKLVKKRKLSLREIKKQRRQELVAESPAFVLPQRTDKGMASEISIDVEMEESSKRVEMMLKECGWIVSPSKMVGQTEERNRASKHPNFPDAYVLSIDLEAVGIVRVYNRVGERRNIEEPIQIKQSLGEHFPFTERKIVSFVYDTTGYEIYFTNYLEPEALDRRVSAFHRPETLVEWLKLAPPDVPTEQSDLLRSRLKRMPLLVQSDLRLQYDDQFETVRALERSLAENRARTLVQIAADNNKAYTVIGSIYRLLREGNAGRLLYLVNGEDQAQQILHQFQEYSIPNTGRRKFTELYNVRYQKNSHFDATAQVCIMAIQRLYAILMGNVPGSVKNLEGPLLTISYHPAIPIEYFDIIVLDECRRNAYAVESLLEYFDAITVGLEEEIDERLSDVFQGNVAYQEAHQKAIGILPNKATGLRRAVILTALQAEYEAVRNHLIGLREEFHSYGYAYETGYFESNWEVALIEVGMGNAGAAAQTERAINHFKPDVILFVGVAGGLKDVRLGDVVAATKIYGYELGKADTTFKSRPEVWYPAHRLEQRARVEARNGIWRQRVLHGKNELPDGRTLSSCRALTGAVAAGEKVITSLDSVPAKLIAETYSDAIAVEMEGAGFLQAVHNNQTVSALVIRGVSDLINNKSETDKLNWQEIAASHAGAFAFEMLARLVEVSKPAVDRSVIIAEWLGQKRAIKVYYSYIDEDKKLLDDLRRQLFGLRRRGQIIDWEKSEVAGGTDTLPQRLAHLDSADLVLVIASTDYLYASAMDADRREEYQHIMQRREAGRSDVIPIIMRPVADWHKEDLGGVQALPRGRKAVSDYARSSDKDRILMEIAQEIGRIVEGIGVEKERALETVRQFYDYVQKEIASGASTLEWSIENSKRMPEIDGVWRAYWRLEPERVSGVDMHREPGDMINLMNYCRRREIDKGVVLEPWSLSIDRRFREWIHEWNQLSSDGQLQWLEMMKDKIAMNLRFEINDFENAPFESVGGLVEAQRLFGDELGKIIRELNERLVREG